MAQAKLVQKTLLTASGCSAGGATAGACCVWKLGLGGGGGAVAAAEDAGLLVEGFGTVGGGFACGTGRLRNSSGGGGAAP